MLTFWGRGREHTGFCLGNSSTYAVYSAHKIGNNINGQAWGHFWVAKR